MVVIRGCLLTLCAALCVVGGTPVELDQDSFQSVTQLDDKDNKVNWLIRFYAKGTGKATEAALRQKLEAAAERAAELPKPLKIQLGFVDVEANEFLRTRFKIKVSEPELALFRRGRMYRYPIDAELEPKPLVHFAECVRSPQDCKVRLPSKPTPPPEAAIYPTTVQELTDGTFEMAVRGGSGDWLVHFYSSEELSRTEEQLFDDAADLLRDTATVGRINIDSHPQTAKRFGIRNAPVVRFFHAGLMYSFPSQAAMQMKSFQDFVECAQNPEDKLCKSGIISGRRIPPKRWFFDVWLDRADDYARVVEQFVQKKMPQSVNNPQVFGVLVACCCAAVVVILWQEATPSRRPRLPAPMAPPPQAGKDTVETKKTK